MARFAAESAVSGIVCTPGNPGIAAVARVVPSDPTDPSRLLDIAAAERIDLTVIGPEVPLSLGVADRFASTGRLLLGPTQAAARLESSKAWAKGFMARHGVPTARFRVFDRADDATAALRSGEFSAPVVIKADGLAAGKGVVIAETLVQAEAAIEAAMTEGRFGTAGSRVVIEECLTGPEVSFFVLCDGTRAVFLGTAQDHKRIFDEDRGPNTGGMGAFAPSPLADAALRARVMREIVDPVMSGMAAEGCPFRGFLYVGLMLTPTGPQVIEFNVRLGDPEAQVILPLPLNPLAPLFAAAATGTLGAEDPQLGSDKLVGVVMASRGYPESSESGRVITGLEDAGQRRGVSVYHAGTALRDGQIVTSGGRVLTIVGRGPDFSEAIARAYDGVAAISFDGMQFRKDIGRKAAGARG